MAEIGGLMSNPWIMAGLSMLAANRPGVSAAQAIGTGGLMGLALASQEKQRQRERGALEEQRDFERQKLAAEVEQFQRQQEQQAMLMQTVPPEMRPWMQAGMEKEVFKRLHPEPSLPTGIVMGPNGERMIDPLYVQMKNMTQPPAPSFNIDLGTEKSYSKKAGEHIADYELELFDSADTATDQYMKARTIVDLLEDADVEGGWGQDMVLKGQRMLKRFGIETKGLSEQEVADKLASQLALSYKESLPGPMSDSDREFLLSLPPSLTTTRQGRKELLGISRKIAQRASEVAALADQYKDSNNGMLDTGFRNFVNQYSLNNPLFGDRGDSTTSITPGEDVVIEGDDDDIPMYIPGKGWSDQQ